MGVVALNIWTGTPLLGLWVGSRVAPGHGVPPLPLSAGDLGGRVAQAAARPKPAV